MKERAKSTSPIDLDHVASLARLSLPPDQRAEFAREIPAILAHFDHLPETTEAAEARVPQAPREDVANEPSGVERAAILSQVPRREGHFVKAPRGL